MSDSHTVPSLITYPCRFPIKVMGVHCPQFVAAMLDIVYTVEPTFDSQNMVQKTSRSGNYLGLTLSIYVISREQLDGLYHCFSSHPMVKMVL